MPTVQSLNKTDIIYKSKSYFLELCNDIFLSVNLEKQDIKIEDASKIRLGLLALELQEDEISIDSVQKILVGLNKLCKIYNQQTINQL